MVDIHNQGGHAGRAAEEWSPRARIVGLVMHLDRYPLRSTVEVRSWLPSKLHSCANHVAQQGCAWSGFVSPSRARAARVASFGQKSSRICPTIDAAQGCGLAGHYCCDCRWLGSVRQPPETTEPSERQWAVAPSHVAMSRPSARRLMLEQRVSPRGSTYPPWRWAMRPAVAPAGVCVWSAHLVCQHAMLRRDLPRCARCGLTKTAAAASSPLGASQGELAQRSGEGAILPPCRLRRLGYGPPTPGLCNRPLGAPSRGLHACFRHAPDARDASTTNRSWGDAPLMRLRGPLAGPLQCLCGASVGKFSLGPPRDLSEGDASGAPLCLCGASPCCLSGEGLSVGRCSPDTPP